MKLLNIKKIVFKKRFLLISAFVIFVILLLVLNPAFGIFSNREAKAIANIKVAGMEYSIKVNGVLGTKITAGGNNTTKANLIVTSLNSRDSKYELIYKVCTNSSCTNFIEKPADLTIEYSSKTIDTITGVINQAETKQIRIVITNNSSNTYYIKIDINAGFIHNTLALQNLITTEYNEEDIIIAAMINGEVSTTFPTTYDYAVSVSCTVNNNPSNTTGTVIWNGSKWILNITGVDSGRTVCNIDFFESLKTRILAQGGGAAAIKSKGNPNFSNNSTSADTGLYAAEDEYGTSYYYRGEKALLNNNIIWGNFQWKIIRINGDGSIRLLYNAPCPNNDCPIYEPGMPIFDWYNWATNNDDTKYLGYMYGGANGVASTSRVGAVLNETSSEMKTNLENWYQTNISSKSFESQVVDNLFCNDRQLQSEVGGAATGPGYGLVTHTFYAAQYRLATAKTPTLKCAQKNDRFTKSDVNIGNGALTHPVGLITADEVAMAGFYKIENETNDTNYLSTRIEWWTMSPSAMYVNNYEGSNYGFPMMFFVTEDGLYNNDFSGAAAPRPVISIKSETLVTGTGSGVDPFKVIS